MIPHENTEYDKDFSRKINIMIRLNHPSLLKYYGYSIDGKAVSILMQYAQKGSLRNIVDKHIRGYDNTVKQKILIGVARGMMHLHKKKIIHRDLKPENIFLDANFNPLIGDFGLSRSSEKNIDMAENVKAPLYTAPEIFVYNENYDESVDVFSHGIMMYEIVTGLVPYNHLPKKILKSKFAFMENVIEGIRPTFQMDFEITNELKLLIEKCWSTNSADRHTFEEIFSMLAYDSSKPTDFVNLFQSENRKYYLKDVNQEEIQSYVEDLLDRENTEQYSIKQSIDQLKQQVDSIQQDNEIAFGQIRTEFDTMKKDILNSLQVKLEGQNQDDFTSHTIDYKKGTKFEGILKHLTRLNGANIHDNKTIKITTNSLHKDDVHFFFKNKKFYHPKNIVDFENDNEYKSNDIGGAIVCFDFKDKFIQLSKYEIQTSMKEKSTSHLKNWVIEVSKDGTNWQEIDRRKNDESLNGPKKSNVFDVQNPSNDFYRYLRIRQIGTSHYNSGNYNIFCISRMDFYGVIKTLIIKNQEDRPTSESIENKIKDFSIKDDDQKMICPSCNHEIMEKSDILHKSGFKYHKECVKCAICGESLKSDEDFDKFVCVTPGLFFCEEDYEKYQVTRHLEKRVLNEYRDKMIKNLIKEIFSPLICNNEEGPFFDENVMQDSLFMSKYYKYFVPTVTFHFSFSPNEIKMFELVQIIPSDMIIVYIEKGSTFLTLAFTLAKELESESNSILQLMCSSKVNSIKEELLKKQELGNLIVGNLIGEPVIKFPTDNDIKEALNDKAINFLQSTEIFDEEIDFEGIRKKVQSFLREEYYLNLRFIKDNYKIYEDAENKVQQDILNNEFEMVIINETIIANNYMKKYERIKQLIIKMLEEHESDDIIQKTVSKDNQDEDDIPKKQKRKDKDDDINADIQKEKNENDVDDDDDNFLEEEEEEEFNKPENEVVLPDNGCDKLQKEPIELNLYHGSNSANHKSIIINHFYRAGNKKVKRLDESYFGKGIYATDNIFYATGYSNDCNILRFNEKASVFCCQAIYNPRHSKLANEINAESMYLSRDTIMNYGVHQAIVGSGYNYHSIDENQIEDHLVVATEFVFPKKSS